MDRKTEAISVRVDIHVTPEVAKAWAEELATELRGIEGDEIPTAPTLGWLVARAFDRQMDPFALLHDDNGDRDETYDWFGADMTDEIMQPETGMTWIHALAEELTARKLRGGDCTDDESAWIKGYFDAYNGGPVAVALALAYPCERNEWVAELAAGNRPNDTGRAILALIEGGADAGNAPTTCRHCGNPIERIGADEKVMDESPIGSLWADEVGVGCAGRGADATEVYPHEPEGMSVVFVVTSYTGVDDDGHASTGGFDWFYRQADALAKFADKDTGTDAHYIGAIEVPGAVGAPNQAERDRITRWLDANPDVWECPSPRPANVPCPRCGEPTEIDGASHTPVHVATQLHHCGDYDDEPTMQDRLYAAVETFLRSVEEIGDVGVLTDDERQNLRLALGALERLSETLNPEAT